MVAGTQGEWRVVDDRRETERLGDWEIRAVFSLLQRAQEVIKSTG
jgi:hypothetical protein